MEPTAVLPLPEVSPEVWAFAAEKGVTDYLPAVLEMTRRLLPHVPIEVLVKDDPELSYNRQIVFEAVVGDMGVDERVAAYEQWSREVFRHCPSTHVHVFCPLLVNEP